MKYFYFVCFLGSENSISLIYWMVWKVWIIFSFSFFLKDFLQVYIH